MLVVPRGSQRLQEHGPGLPGAEGLANEPKRGTTGTKLVADRTCSWCKLLLQAPLRQAVGNNGTVVVKVPISITDLINWKKLAGIYVNDPEQVAKAFEMMIQTQDPDWKDTEVIAQVLFDSTEK